jgi:AAA+ superfamily predicted ATPase
MKDTDVNLYRPGRLYDEFGAFADPIEGDEPAVAARDIVGAPYRRILAEITAIVAHQWRNEIERSALKGFLFHGGVGIGKTTMARRLTYELARIFGRDVAAADIAHRTGARHSHAVGLGHDQALGHTHDESALWGIVQGDDVVLVVIDGADIARGRYGDSEEQLRRLFQFARDGEVRAYHHEDEPVRRTVLLFDDVESLFLARSSGGAKEWHFSQNSVFFHAMDELDTSRTAVVLTTNRIDLLDEAIVDRFLPYEFGTPPKDVLIEVARHRAALQKLDDAALAGVLADVEAGVTSIRAVERLVTRAYIASIVGHPVATQWS